MVVLWNKLGKYEMKLDKLVMTLNNYFFISYKDEKSKLGGKIDYMVYYLFKEQRSEFLLVGSGFNEEFLGKYNLYI